MSFNIGNINVIGGGPAVVQGNLNITHNTTTIDASDPIRILYNNDTFSQVRVRQFSLDIEKFFAGNTHDQKSFMVQQLDMSSNEWELFVQSGNKHPFSHFIDIELRKNHRKNFDKLVTALRIADQNECLNIIFPRNPVTFTVSDSKNVQVGTGSQTMFVGYNEPPVYKPEYGQKTNTPEWKNSTVQNILYGGSYKSHARDNIRMELETHFDDFNHRVKFAQNAAKKKCSMPTGINCYTTTDGEEFIQLISKFIQPKIFLKILAKNLLNHATELKKLLNKQKEDATAETVDQLQKTSDLYVLLENKLKSQRFDSSKITMVMSSLREENFETADDLKMLAKEKSWNEYAGLGKFKGRDKLILRKVLKEL